MSNGDNLENIFSVWTEITLVLQKGISRSTLFADL